MNSKSVSVDKVATHKLITIPVGRTVFEARQMMADRRIRHLPVVDIDGEVLGVVSQKDIANTSRDQKFPIELFMSAPVETVQKGETLRVAILKMLEKKISCLLVVDDDEAVEGIVTTDDVLWYLAHLLKEDDEAHLGSVMNLQFVGDFARRLSEAGI